MRKELKGNTCQTHLHELLCKLPDKGIVRVAVQLVRLPLIAHAGSDFVGASLHISLETVVALLHKMLENFKHLKHTRTTKININHTTTWRGHKVTFALVWGDLRLIRVSKSSSNSALKSTILHDKGQMCNCQILSTLWQ